MTSDYQIRRLRNLMSQFNHLKIAASKVKISENTARKYLRAGQLPSEMKKERHWRTRKDSFEEVWGEISHFLGSNSGLESKTIFEYLQRKYPGVFQDGQLRTLQRKRKAWRALYGDPQEVFFNQQHHPGKLCESDFSHMNELQVTIQGQLFNHLIYHFVLTYSNWESISICYSESFESLSSGLNQALLELGGIPEEHRLDHMSSAVHKLKHPELFTSRYREMMDHYHLKATTIQVAKPNENGDVEQAHHRFKRAVDQALMLRGWRDFSSLEEYQQFLKKICQQRNQGRILRLKEELPRLRTLPASFYPSFRTERVKVRKTSTIQVQKNTYSVDSRLIGERVEARIFMDHIKLFYGQKQVDQFPRLRGDGKHQINYRHIIDSLVRKPGAFENYRYREDLFPSTYFRMTWDFLKQKTPQRANKEYLSILHLAAKESEDSVNRCLQQLLEEGQTISAERVQQWLDTSSPEVSIHSISITPVNLYDYDKLLAGVPR